MVELVLGVKPGNALGNEFDNTDGALAGERELGIEGVRLAS
jgi:hypothetical protein